MKTIQRKELEQYLADYLQIHLFRDYCPNGLQVEGKNEIRRLVTGVTASQALIEQAADQQADAILVHHGYFWKGEDPRLVGFKHKRIQTLIRHDVSLFAYHLPLDAHPECGNNIQLAQLLNLRHSSNCGEHNLVYVGYCEQTSLQTVGDLANWIEQKLKRKPQVIGDENQILGKLAWCTGAAQSYLADAIQAGAQIYLSGEISEPTVHLAREAGVAYLACGHHATERYGVKALGEHIQQQLGISVEFVDVDNPV